MGEACRFEEDAISARQRFGGGALIVRKGFSIV
jgi:hypothetical protein